MADTNSKALARATTDSAVVLSPLLNLAPASASGPRLNQSRPILPLGESGLGGTAMLSLSPDRKQVDVSVDLHCATPVSIRLRRLATHLRDGGGSDGDDLLIIEIVEIQAGLKQFCTSWSFSLEKLAACLPFERMLDLEKLGTCPSALRASSIGGVRVEPAQLPELTGRRTEYVAKRMLTEISAAERSASAIAASRHVELANLYARQL
ncbi:MAG: hypothetical protein M3Q08_03345 [Pseudomonadota bacterium]|nr:hypothetical protein [Pseudomonadota bacterium]